jgi:glycosyltransferase involved in cell wall biosynthesis
VKKRVAILIAVYKASGYVESKIASLLDQTALDQAQVVLLNCQDLENESHLFRTFKTSDNVLEIVYTNYKKLYGTWNDGIKASNSDFIVNYNMDDQWHPDFLKKCISFLDANPDFATVSTRVLITDTPNQVWSRKQWHPTDELPFLPYPLSSAGPSPMWRRSLHEKYGLFQDHYVISDALMWEKWLEGGEKFGLIDEPLTLYYRNPNSLERRHEGGMRLIDIDLKEKEWH